MQFKLNLYSLSSRAMIPINYQYPLSAAIYKILQKGDAEYSSFLHEVGYGKGYKFFTFSDLKGKMKRNDDRLEILNPVLELTISFHLPKASKTFVEGLFRSENITIADSKSAANFSVQKITSLKNPIEDSGSQNERLDITVKPISALVAGYKDDRGIYQFLEPSHNAYIPSLIINWRNKITAAYGEDTANLAKLEIEVERYPNSWRSRLITIKANSPQETRIRGFINFKLKLTAERRFIELILNSGLGLYTAQGMGCLRVVKSNYNTLKKNNYSYEIIS